MKDPREINNTLVLSYLDLRKSVGTIGIFLPFVLAIGKILLEGPGILGSISSYYYSSMRNVFVGSMCAIGVFLWSYKGYDWRDAVAGTIAAVCAIGVALFPTTPDKGTTAATMVPANIHTVFAGVFFLALAYFALILFLQTHPNVPPTRMKLVRNKGICCLRLGDPCSDRAYCSAAFSPCRLAGPSGLSGVLARIACYGRLWYFVVCQRRSDPSRSAINWSTSVIGLCDPVPSTPR